MVATKDLHRGIGGATARRGGFGSQPDAAWPQRNVSSLVKFQRRRGAVTICVIKSEHAPVAPGTHVKHALETNLIEVVVDALGGSNQHFN